MVDVSEMASVRLETTVDVPVARAFQVFTQTFDRIKPREHNLLSVEIAETVLEPWVGGRIYDRGVDGTECHWGRVLAVEPPHRILLTWDISPRWQLETDPARASEVEVRFVDEEGATRVVLEHRHLDRHLEGWQSMRQALVADDGWSRYLDRFAALVQPGGAAGTVRPA